ncbi:MAG: hypothetical protein INQ03_22075 [Candidatus Heimdallarchaeota archaeon]|nr:hypothetical protein [Candidatus Heimdallarchaeota archaeon]
MKKVIIPIFIFLLISPVSAQEFSHHFDVKAGTYEAFQFTIDGDIEEITIHIFLTSNQGHKYTFDMYILDEAQYQDKLDGNDYNRTWYSDDIKNVPTCTYNTTVFNALANSIYYFVVDSPTDARVLLDITLILGETSESAPFYGFITGLTLLLMPIILRKFRNHSR